MSQFDHISIGPLYPPQIRNISSGALYQHISKQIADHSEAGTTREEVVRQISNELIPQLSKSVEDFRLQSLRRQIAHDWADVLNKLDNLGHLTGWLMLKSLQERIDNERQRELHLALCLLALEAPKNVFAIVNQLRSALVQDTFVYLRTLHEILVKSHFILKFSEQDPELPGRFFYCTNKTYLDLYKRLSMSESEQNPDNIWDKTEQLYGKRYQELGQGDYGWCYPLILTKQRKPKKRPTFRDLINMLDDDSHFSRIYYYVSTSKGHGGLVQGPMTYPETHRHFRTDLFGVGDIGLVMDLMLPLFKGVLENTTSSCIKSEHAIVMDIARNIIGNIRECVGSIKSSNPEMHGGLES